MPSANIFANFLLYSMNGLYPVDLNGGDVLMMGLLTSSYTPDPVGASSWGTVSVDEITGTGYTAGGVALSGCSLTLTAANSWSQSWAAATGYATGQIIRPATGNGLLYRAVIGGTSGGSTPTFPTALGEVVTDNTITWATMGEAALVFTSNPAQWPGATFSARYGAIYDQTSGDLLIVLEDFGSVFSPVTQTFEVAPDPVLGWAVFTPPS